MSKIKKDQHEYIIKQFLWPNNMSMQEIANEFDVTREAIRQILKKYGYTNKDGGMAYKTKIKREKERKSVDWKKDRKAKKIYGCDSQTVSEINSGRLLTCHLAPALRYKGYIRYLKLNNIKYSLTLPEWYDIWIKSGHYSEDPSDKYKHNMVRIDDTKPVTADNVKILPSKEHGTLIQKRIKQNKEA